MHLRYLPPRKINESSVYPPYMATGVETEALPGKRSTSIPYPAVFWACPADSGLKMSVNPFDRVNLGYDGLFGPKTMFWHVLPSMGKTLSVALEVPVMNMERATNVESATAFVVLVGFAWVCWKLFAGWQKGQDRKTESKPKVGKKGKKQK